LFLGFDYQYLKGELKKVIILNYFMIEFLLCLDNLL